MKVPNFIKAIPTAKTLSVVVTVLNGLGTVGALLNGKVEHYEKEAMKQSLKAELKKEIIEELLANK